MKFDLLKGPLADEFIMQPEKLNTLEKKIMDNILKLVMAVSKTKYYLLEHFLFQTKSGIKLLENNFSEDLWRLSCLETGFYHLSTIHIFTIFCKKIDRQISLDYVLGQLVENAKMGLIPSILTEKTKIVELEELRNALFDQGVEEQHTKLRTLRDGGSGHFDINFDYPQIIKIKDIHELYIKANNTTVQMLKSLSLSTDSLQILNTKIFHIQIEKYLMDSGIDIHKL